jgi:Zn-dependent peptidase ImmA (M78 family)
MENSQLIVRFRDKEWNITELAAACDVPEHILRRRLLDGWEVDAAVNTPVKERNHLSDDEEDKAFARYSKGDISLRALADEFGVSRTAMHNLMKKRRGE